MEKIRLVINNIFNYKKPRSCYPEYITSIQSKNIEYSKILIKGKYLYTSFQANKPNISNFNNDGVSIMDVENVEKPKIIGKTKKIGGHGYVGLRGFCIKDNLLYYAAGYSWLKIINISNRRKPEVIVTIRRGLENVVKVEIIKGYLFLEHWYADDDYTGLKIYDLQNGIKIRPIGGISNPTFNGGITFNDDNIFLYSKETIKIFSFQKDCSINKLGVIDRNNIGKIHSFKKRYIFELFRFYNKKYSKHYLKLRIKKLLNLDILSEIRIPLNIDLSAKLFIFEKYAVIYCYNEFDCIIFLIDIEDLQNPCLLTYFKLPNDLRYYETVDILIKENYCLISAENSRIMIYRLNI